jgi:hypothetical protein
MEQAGWDCASSMNQKMVVKNASCGMGYLRDVSGGESRMGCFSWHQLMGRIRIRKANDGQGRVARLHRWIQLLFEVLYRHCLYRFR